MLGGNYKKQLDDLFLHPMDASNFVAIKNKLDFLKSSGYTEDDLKPYIDKLGASGFQYDYNSGQGGATPGFVPKPLTPPDQGPPIPVNPNLPTDVPGQTIPGPAIPLNSDQGNIEQEAAREKQQGLDVLGQQQKIRQGVLTSLGPILQQQADAQFAYDLPGIKEDLQTNGALNSSALANAVARERANLLAPQLSQLQQYGLSANDQYASGLGNILGQQQELQQGGLQRTFSLADYQRQAQLAKDIGAQMVPNGPSPFLTGLQGAGTGAVIGSVVPGLGTGLGAGLGGAIGLIGGATGNKGGGGTFICTHLYKLGFMTKKEIKNVHRKIFIKKFKHPFSLAAYWLLAPIFISANPDYDWKSLKARLCDEVLSAKDSEEAFSLYMGTCLEIFFKSFEVKYGY